LRKRTSIKECVACWTCFTEEQLAELTLRHHYRSHHHLTTHPWYCPSCVSSWISRLNLVHQPGELVWFNDDDDWHPAVVEAHEVEDSKDEEGYRLRTFKGSKKASDDDVVDWSTRGLGAGEDRHAAYRWALGFAAKMARDGRAGDEAEGHEGNEPFDSQATVEFGGSI